MIGRTLAHYRIIEGLGAGGMGEVYRARDEKLGRDVALKVLPADSLSDEAARKRFGKEAEALVRLGHPHLATLYDVGSRDGVDFLVMELVPGPTLEEELRKGSLAEKDVVRLGIQLVRGLMSAHGHGVVHRDLKPSNLALTEDGLLKVLDFGLARLVYREDVGGEAESTATVGQVVGSPPYMSPEQLRGRGVDERADLYAVGAVLFEMATGQRVFGERSGVELQDAILHEPPPSLRSVDSRLSPGLESVILKALDKDPELRYQTARDLLVDLERLQQRLDGTPPGRRFAVTSTVSPGRSLGRRWAWILGAAALPLLAAAWLGRPPPPPRVTNVRPLTGGLDPVTHRTKAWSSWATDGVRLYYIGEKRGEPALLQVPITGGEAAERPLPFRFHNAIHGYLPGESALLMSGSDRELSGSEDGPPLWIVPVPAGAPSRIGTLGTWPAAAAPDGRTIAAVNPKERTILVARRDGSIERKLGPLPSAPWFLAWGPDGRRIRYTAAGPKGPAQWIWEISLDEGRARPLWPGSYGRWSGDGRYFLFQRERSQGEAWNDVYAVREDRPFWAGPSEPFRLTSGPLDFALPGSSPDGQRLFAWGASLRGEVLRWDAGSGRFEPYLGGISAITVTASPDGSWLAWVGFPDGVLWRSRTDGTDRLRLTGKGWRAYRPRWSPDSRRIVFSGSAPDAPPLSLYLVSRRGDPPELLVRNEHEADNDGFWDPCWEPSGAAVLFSYMTGHFGVYRVDLTTRTGSLVPGTERLHYPKCSPRGDILAMFKPPPDYGDPSFRVRYAGRSTWEPFPGGLAGYQEWSADAESVIALDPATKRIMRWSRATGDVEVVTDVADIPLLNLSWVPWMGMAHDGSPLVVRDRSSRDIYAFDWEAP